MRIRTPFAGGFLALLLISAYLGLSTATVGGQHDKVLHFATFFLLTTCFYWILDTNRRRNLHLTLIVCTLALGIGSEVLQGLLPNGRFFDPYDIAANLLGSVSGLGLCSWYHKRMLERRRAAKQFNVVPGDGDVDLELGEQESGVTQSLEEQVDNWDENAEDNWDDDTAEAAKPAETVTENENGKPVEEDEDAKGRPD